MGQDKQDQFLKTILLKLFQNNSNNWIHQAKVQEQKHITFMVNLQRITYNKKVEVLDIN